MWMGAAQVHVGEQKSSSKDAPATPSHTADDGASAASLTSSQSGSPGQQDPGSSHDQVVYAPALWALLSAANDMTTTVQKPGHV